MWSFGVTCWEAFSNGAEPYGCIDCSTLALKLDNGHRLEKTDQCPNEVYNIIYKCWLNNKKMRPTFSDLVKEFENAIKDWFNFSSC